MVVRKAKFIIQKIFRKTHTSDREVWNLYDSMAPHILRKLKQFRKSRLVGHPSVFVEYNKNEWKSREEYDEAVRKGDIIGGGQKEWVKVLDEIIYGFEYIVYYNGTSEKKRRKFLEKYCLVDPFEKCKENKHTMYTCKTEDDDAFMMTSEKEETKGREIVNESVYYCDSELEKQYLNRAMKSLEMFGKYYFNLWD